MRRILLLALLAATLAAAAQPPKLVLFIVVDQFRYDYITRFRSEFRGGFDRLLRKGASFTQAHHNFFPTLTAVGHATLITGAMPSVTGIIGNDWFDRKAGKQISSVSDDNTRPIGGAAKGASPHQLLAPTIGDALKKAKGGRPRVLGISIKDRSAILMAGAKGDAAYWFDDESGVFVTSSYYRSDLPDWVRRFGESHPADQYLGATWLNHLVPVDSKPRYKRVAWSPFGNELIGALAGRAVEAEKLGGRKDPDLLAVSFSSTDYVGHDYGPDSPEAREAILRMDGLLDQLFQSVDRAVGLESVLVVLSSDHGAPTRTDMSRTPPIAGGSVLLTVVSDAVQAALEKTYGPGKWVAGCYDVLIYLNRELIAQKKLDSAEVNRRAAEAVLQVPHIARAYTREQILDGRTLKDETGRMILNGYHRERGADVQFLPEPYWVFTDLYTTHGTTYSYDTHVPVIFMGPGIRAETYDTPVVTNDIAPTLAKVLGIPKPAGSTGRVLTEMLAK